MPFAKSSPSFYKLYGILSIALIFNSVSSSCDTPTPDRDPRQPYRVQERSADNVQLHYSVSQQPYQPHCLCHENINSEQQISRSTFKDQRSFLLPERKSSVSSSNCGNNIYNILGDSHTGLVVRKLVFEVSDLVRHKPSCAITE